MPGEERAKAVCRLIDAEEKKSLTVMLKSNDKEITTDAVTIDRDGKIMGAPN